jgi:hypothetical protein
VAIVVYLLLRSVVPTVAPEATVGGMPVRVIGDRGCQWPTSSTTRTV